MNRYEKANLLGFLVVISVKPMTWIQFVLAMLFGLAFVLGGELK